MAGRRCPKCQQVIIGSGHLYNGKLYCDQCYKLVMEETLNIENEKRGLFDFIKELFGIEEIPESWIVKVDKLLRSGKTIAGIKMTLTYYYNILGHEPIPTYGLSIIDGFYEETRQYAIKQQEIMQKTSKMERKGYDNGAIEQKDLTPNMTGLKVLATGHLKDVRW